jgi:hypothetical protein
MAGAALSCGRAGPIGWWAVAGTVFGLVVGYAVAPDPSDVFKLRSGWDHPVVTRAALAGQCIGFVIGSIGLFLGWREPGPTGDTGHETA